MWPRFGDKHLDYSLGTLTQDAHKKLTEKHLDMQKLHSERLGKAGINMPVREAPQARAAAVRSPQEFSIASDDERFNDMLDEDERADAILFDALKIGKFTERYLRPTSLPTALETPLPESDSEFEDASEGRPLPTGPSAAAAGPLGRLAGDAATYMGRSFKNNVKKTAELAAEGGKRAADVLREMQVGTKVAEAADTAKTRLMELSGPPLALGGHLAVEGAKHTASAALAVGSGAVEAGKVVAPVLGEGALAAGKVIGKGTLAAGKGAFHLGVGLTKLMSRATWRLLDVIAALDEVHTTPALGDASSSSSREIVPVTGTDTGLSRRRRSKTPPPRTATAAAAAEPEARNFEHSYATPEEWLTSGHSNKGFLIEEIYKRPGWAQLMGVADKSGYHSRTGSTEFAQNLKKMSRQDLAQVLVHLDKQR